MANIVSGSNNGINYDVIGINYDSYAKHVYHEED